MYVASCYDVRVFDARSLLFRKIHTRYNNTVVVWSLCPIVHNQSCNGSRIKAEAECGVELQLLMYFRTQQQ